MKRILMCLLHLSLTGVSGRGHEHKLHSSQPSSPLREMMRGAILDSWPIFQNQKRNKDDALLLANELDVESCAKKFLCELAKTKGELEWDEELVLKQFTKKVDWTSSSLFFNIAVKLGNEDKRTCSTIYPMCSLSKEDMTDVFRRQGISFTIPGKDRNCMFYLLWKKTTDSNEEIRANVDPRMIAFDTQNNVFKFDDDSPKRVTSTTRISTTSTTTTTKTTTQTTTTTTTTTAKTTDKTTITMTTQTQTTTATTSNIADALKKQIAEGEEYLKRLKAMQQLMESHIFDLNSDENEDHKVTMEADKVTRQGKQQNMDLNLLNNPPWDTDTSIDLFTQGNNTETSNRNFLSNENYSNIFVQPLRSKLVRNAFVVEQSNGANLRSDHILLFTMVYFLSMIKLNV